MDESDPVSWLSLAKKHFKNNQGNGCYYITIDARYDIELPNSTYRYVHMHACKASCTKHVIEVINFSTFSHVGDFIVFRRKTENKM